MDGTASIRGGEGKMALDKMMRGPVRHAKNFRFYPKCYEKPLKSFKQESDLMI